jgi:hypothetical protein
VITGQPDLNRLVFVMNIDQVESAILSLGPEDRRQLLHWFERHRDALFGGEASAEDLSQEQKAEILRRRQEHTENPERFLRMDELGLNEMSARIRGHVAARFSSTS